MSASTLAMLAGAAAIAAAREEIESLRSKNATLAQRCRELEAERNHFAIQAQRFYNERNALRAEVEEARRTAGFWKDEHLAGNRVIDQLRAEVSDLKARLLEQWTERSAALPAEVADLKARLLEAERGNEELVRLREDTRVLRIALDRIAERADAFVSDDACMQPDSAAAISMIARNALGAAHDES